MQSKIKKIVYFICLITFIFLVLVIPFTLLFVGIKKSGIDLRKSLLGNFSSESFFRLIWGQNSIDIAFRNGLIRSICFSIIDSLLGIFFGLFYTIRILGYAPNKAMSSSFTMLTLVLLPQTYLILPVVFLLQKIPMKFNENILIMFCMLLGVIPICAWMLYLIGGKRIGIIMEMCALDKIKIYKMIMNILKELKIELIILFLFIFGFIWGNYLIPFSFGSKNSFTVLIEISSFTTNLGKNWALICAASFIVCLPSIILGLFLAYIIRNHKLIK